MFFCSYQGEHKCEVDCGDQPVCAGSRVAAVVPVHIARPFAAEAVEETQDVTDQDEKNKAGHAKANIVPERGKTKIVSGSKLSLHFQTACLLRWVQFTWVQFT